MSRRRRLVPVAIVCLVAVSCGGSHHTSAPTSSFSSSTTSASSSTSLPPDSSAPLTSSSTTATTAPRSTTAPPPPTTPSSLPPPSDDWVVQSFHAGQGADGNWTGSARIRNASGTARQSNFAFTLTRNGRVVAKLSGLVSVLAGGSSSDVALTSTDRYTSGAYSYTFSASFGF